MSTIADGAARRRLLSVLKGSSQRKQWARVDKILPIVKLLAQQNLLQLVEDPVADAMRVAGPDTEICIKQAAHTVPAANNPLQAELGR